LSFEPAPAVFFSVALSAAVLATSSVAFDTFDTATFTGFIVAIPKLLFVPIDFPIA
jgi:hypothetical protein